VNRNEDIIINKFSELEGQLEDRSYE